MYKRSEKKKEYDRLYRLANKDKFREWGKKSYNIHREKRIKEANDWRLNNPERHMTTRRAYVKTPRGRLSTVKASSKTRGIDYFLTDDEALVILSTPCFYCGSPEVGIDRIDSSKGYLLSNCTSCCAMCNYMKRTYSIEQFIAQCKLIAQKHL